MRDAPVVGAAARFRFDINALRAIAVIAVLGYHLQIPGFAGGFAGVDVFLVITGYLMTRKALNDLIVGRFSYRDFTAMRLRRIYPALAVVVVVTAIAEWFVTLPGEYFRHLRQACYSLFFLSNFAYDNDNGYFAMAAQTKPLLHTWSLAIEWQFYIWMPLAVWLVWRRSSSSNATATVARIFVIVVAASLVWCVWEYHHDAMGSAFFSLRARAWEPLVGGLIAIAEIRRRASGLPSPRLLSSSVPAIAGWFLIAACIITPLPKASWPGPLTLLPVAGAALVICAGRMNSSFIRLPIVQSIGDWSYSIYLWHWPIWVLAGGWLTLHGYAADAAAKALMVVATIGISAFSYRYVEQPIRIRRDLWTDNRLLAGSGAVFASFLAFTIAGIVTTGFPGRLPSYLQAAELARKTDTPRDECFRNSNSVKRASEIYCRFGGGKGAGEPAVILWGDSFANQFLDPLSSAASGLGLQGFIATQSACRAFLDDDGRNANDTPQCRSFNGETLRFVLSKPAPNIVVLASNWSDATEIAALVDKLLSNGKTVILVKPLLNISFDVPQRWIEDQIRAGKAINEWKVPADPALTMEALRTGVDRILADRRSNSRLIAIDPQQEICSGGYCYLVQDGQANFRDTAHISNVNASRYEGQFARALKAAQTAALQQASAETKKEPRSP
ncbi:acyltransferase [Bradyrhizobium sp. Pear76]|uniref:acyltransferase family protein n=1 Tax=Bradyrhizobium oropedii TaxID=1571201 RepID=UPI001E3AAEE1|nr:acyltransferase family protein [Bradyrhizobium oropedii]MCC8968186.1 acyltransferase [Bradyrhizobium oropedii]